MKKTARFKPLKSRIWIVGRIRKRNPRSFLLSCEETGFYGIVPFACIYNTRKTITEGVIALVIYKEFKELEKFKALNFSEVQGLLKNDTVGTT